MPLEATPLHLPTKKTVFASPRLFTVFLIKKNQVNPCLHTRENNNKHWKHKHLFPTWSTLILLHYTEHDQYTK